ncbi:hypothetical protein HDV63DRAFT_330272 [Trichoderma sp. SZMC 28014]
MASSCNESPSLVLPGTSMRSVAMQPGLAAHSFEEHCKLNKSNWWRRSWVHSSRHTLANALLPGSWPF